MLASQRPRVAAYTWYDADMVFEAAAAVLLLLVLAVLGLVCVLWLAQGQVSRRQIKWIAFGLVAVAMAIGMHPRLLPDLSRPIGSDSVLASTRAIQIGGRVKLAAPWQHRAAFLSFFVAIGLSVFFLARRPAPLRGWLLVVALVSLSVGLSVTPPKLQLTILISGGGGIRSDSMALSGHEKSFRLESCFTEELFDLEIGTGGERRLGLRYEDALPFIDAALVERMALDLEWPDADRRLLVWSWVARHRSKVDDEVRAARELVHAFVEEVAAKALVNRQRQEIASGTTSGTSPAFSWHAQTLLESCRHPDRIRAVLESAAPRSDSR